MRNKILLSIALIYGLLPALPALAMISDDPHVEQWGYEDTGVYDAWKISTGSSDVVVAVIDNGFDSRHPDLRDNLWKNEDEIPNNGIDDDNNGYIDDTEGWNWVPDPESGISVFDRDFIGTNDPRPDVSNLTNEEKDAEVYSHGTVVAGIIGAVGNNNRDGAGINWDVSLMNLKVLGNDGFGSLDQMPNAIRYAVDNGAHVINISIVGDANFKKLNDALQYAYNNDVFVVVAAGNGDANGNPINLNTTKMYPICSDSNSSVGFVIGASAIAEDHFAASFSNYGSDCIDMTAPGVGINSTVRYSPTNGLEHSYGFGWQGTSFASPFIAGAAALVKSVQPTWGAKEIQEALFATLHKTPPSDEAAYANSYGKGLLQVGEAVKYAKNAAPAEVPPTTPPTTPTETPVEVPQKVIDSKNRILSYQPLTGEVDELNVETNRQSNYIRNGLIGIDKVVSFLDENDEPRYAVAKRVDDSTRRITIYNNKFFRQSYFDIPASGKIDIAVGDFHEEDGIEIAVSPQYADDQLFRVFSMSGIELDQVSIGFLHDGVRVATVKNNKETPRDDIITLFTYVMSVEDVPAVEIYTEGLLFDAFDLDDYAKGGTIAAGDIDADGEDEFIVGSGPGQNTTLVYYELNGNLKSQFYGYNPGFTGGINAQILDFDLDGDEDVLISALDGTKPVRVWNREVKRLANWYPFGENFVGEFSTISSF